MGSNPVESPEFFRFMRQWLKLSSKCEDHIFILFYMLIYYTQRFWVFENNVIGRCQGLFPPMPSSAEKSPGNEVGETLLSRSAKNSQQQGRFPREIALEKRLFRSRSRFWYSCGSSQTWKQRDLFLTKKKGHIRRQKPTRSALEHLRSHLLSPSQPRDQRRSKPKP